MTEYRRARIPGVTSFFTVNCVKRKQNRILTDNIDILRKAFSRVKKDHPFEINAIVVLPEHLHCIWTLPQNDSDSGTRWGLIKANFSRHIPKTERRSGSRQKRGERGIWQRRFWEQMDDYWLCCVYLIFDGSENRETVPGFPQQCYNVRRRSPVNLVRPC